MKYDYAVVYKHAGTAQVSLQASHAGRVAPGKRAYLK